MTLSITRIKAFICIEMKGLPYKEALVILMGVLLKEDSREEYLCARSDS
jgi:hypothetical protein